MEASRPSNPKDKMTSTFPFDQLAHEIQLMIAKESVISATPVAVGCLPGSLSSSGGYTGAILRTCRAFNREDLHKLFYKNNVFEIMNSDWRNFFQHRGINHIQRVILRTYSIHNWHLNMLWLTEQLRLLENLQDVGIKVEGRWDNLWVTGNSPLEAQDLRAFLRVLCRVCKNLHVIQILINHDHAKDMMSDWNQFLENSLKRHLVWPAGMPDGRKPVTFVVRECSLLKP